MSTTTKRIVGGNLIVEHAKKLEAPPRGRAPTRYSAFVAVGAKVYKLTYTETTKIVMASYHTKIPCSDVMEFRALCDLIAQMEDGRGLCALGLCGSYCRD